LKYSFIAIDESEVPHARHPGFAHVVATYVSETNKTASMWRAVPQALLDFRPRPEVHTVRQIVEHQLLSERRFFASFVGLEEGPPEACLPSDTSAIDGYLERYVDMARARLPQLAEKDEPWWLEERPFFEGLHRQRIWIFWRRVLHTCHHRTQVQTWLRLGGGPVPPIYGPSGDVRGDDDDPTYSVEAAGR
jgi:uncharacterized damage-inducible protein DinB